jgi:NitT/TauT family transport system substrate-binding protein
MAYGFSSCSNNLKQQLSIGSTHHEADTLIYIADEQGFFAANGLDVTIKDYNSGAVAVEGMLKSEVDVTTCSEYVIVQNAFKQHDVRTMGVISKSSVTRIVARTDRGILSVADLQGKKVGVPIGTLAQFQFGRFLDLRGMHDKPITIINTAVSVSVDAIVGGEVDAVITWEPFVSGIKEQLGENVIVWFVDNEQPQLKNIISTGTWLEQHPDTALRILKSLSQAETFAINQPDRVRSMVEKRLQYDDDYMNLVWPQLTFSLSLDYSLLTAMEDEARWMIANNLTTQTQVLDFTKYMYIDGLKSVKPETINIR